MKILEWNGKKYTTIVDEEDQFEFHCGFCSANNNRIPNGTILGLCPNTDLNCDFKCYGPNGEAIVLSEIKDESKINEIRKTN